MVELFEQDLKTNDRQSSKGNQLKWENNGIWYKSDYTGYEGLSEYVISHLLCYSNLNKNEFAIYNPVSIKYKSRIFNFLRYNRYTVSTGKVFGNISTANFSLSL